MPLGKFRTIAVERGYYDRFRSAFATLSEHKCTPATTLWRENSFPEISFNLTRIRNLPYLSACGWKNSSIFPC
jgi:hypothetical protein